MNAIATREQQNPLLLIPQSLEQLDHIAKLIARSDLAPKDYKGKPENVAVAIAMGLELGVSPMQAIQGIAVINGRPSVWGDLMMALCRAHPACEWIDERMECGADGWPVSAVCRAKRRGSEVQERRFSMDDARRAGLANKDGPWKQYTARMLQMRARAFCLRDVFADALRGLDSAEEQGDVIEGHFTEIQPPSAKPALTVVRQELQPYPAEDFEANLGKWRGVIESGKKSADDIIAMVSTKGTLTEDQKARIRGDGAAAQEQAA